MISVAVCYIAALLLELFRLALRIRKGQIHWGTILAAFGFVLHTVYIYRQHVVYQQHVVAENPIGGTAMLLLASAWGLMLIYFLWKYYYPNIPFGIMLIPLALLLLGGNFLSVSVFEPSGLSIRSFAKMLHVVFAAGTVIALVIGGICRILYAFEVHLLRKKRSLSPPNKLPSLEWSLSAYRASIVVALVFVVLMAVAILLNWAVQESPSHPAGVPAIMFFPFPQCCVSSV